MKYSLILCLFFASQITLAETAMKVDDTGDVVTNSKLKAIRGSDSKYSIKMNFKYLGAGIQDLGEGKRPNPDKSVVAPETELQGTVGVAYRIDKGSTFSFGTGVAFIEPEKGFDRAETSEPYLQYARSYSAVGMEHNSYGKIGYYTGRNREVGRDLHFVLGHYAAKKMGSSRFTVGVDTGIGTKTFTKFNKDDHDWGWVLAPFTEYLITDGLTVTAVVTTGGSHYRRGELLSDTILAELGLGYSLTDNIYLNPVIAMYPENSHIETTTLSINTIINVF